MMFVSASTTYGLTLSAALYASAVDALAFRRYDGIHRTAKSPQITQPTMLLQRKGDVCGAGMKLCPANLGGNCCPENYACAIDGCYSTTTTTSTSSVPSHTYSCPTSQYLCPSSVGYGCCPNGMGCGVSRCYSTQPITTTVTTAITSTASGTITTLTTTAIIVRSPSVPTSLGTLDDRTNDDDDIQTTDSSATTVPKYTPPAETDRSDDQDNSSLSTTQLGGIIGGAVALLALVVAAAAVLIRHIDRLGSQMSRKSSSSKSSSATKQTSVSSYESGSSRTDSTRESLRRSRARRKPRSRSTVRRNRQRRNGLIATRSGNFMTERSLGRQDSADISLEVLTRTVNCGGAVVSDTRHGYVVSPTPINDVSPRLLSSPSPISDTELEASSLAQELAGISTASTLAADLLIHYPQDIPPSDLPRVAMRPPLAYQWMRSIGLLRQSENTSPDEYCIDDEEWHGFYGSRDHMAGRTGLGIYTQIRGGGHRQYR
ncbi:hypothetical protein T069G_08695 [Trichoderma breve]|uniref:Uncharacterized protein n=1 Tax=Trichoderma breve TaxID=2034170 RepID=A0A9W9B740_9HYPO|nr:hypothetical protein T069G_08695 [Trichoderma breve]KAJ4857798.1 hypothetical protein T069G_08695 [Trichoderma breve]